MPFSRIGCRTVSIRGTDWRIKTCGGNWPLSSSEFGTTLPHSDKQLESKNGNEKDRCKIKERN